MADFISICMCTYKRDELRETLRSLADLTPTNAFKTEIIVADNDAVPSAKTIVDNACKDFGIKVQYIHAPKQNISVARNACLDAAKGNLVAFVDDDQVVSADWLINLHQQVRGEGCDVVFGPVWAIYPEGSPEWLQEMDFHSKVIKEEVPITGYTGNVLMDITHPAIEGRRFNLNRGRTGGEDTQFFYEAKQCGAKLSYNEDASCSEDVVPARLSIRWMLQTKFRSGLTLGLVRKKYYSRFTLMKNTVMTSLKIAFCALGALVTFPFRQLSMNYLFRATFHSGVLAANFNMTEQVLYG